MVIYLLTFVISIILLLYAEKKQNNTERGILIFSALVLPCIIAGVRAENIGTDVRVYVKPIFEAAKNASNIREYLNSSWFAEWRYKYVSQFEVGFTLIIYVLTKLFHSMSVVLFIIEVMIVVPVYKGIKNILDNKNVWLGMLVFYLMHYNSTFNMMRQWIAMAILFYAYSFLKSKHYGKYLLCVCVAASFHKTAIVGVCVFALVMLLEFVKKKEIIIFNKLHINESSILIMIFVFSVVALFGLKYIISFMKIIGVDGFINYINGDVKFLPNQIIVRLPIIFMLVLSWKQLKQKNEFASFYAAMILLDVMSSQLVSINMYAFRIGLYFSEYSIYSLPIMLNMFEGKKKQIIKVLLIIYMFVYWAYYFAFKGMHETIPYMWG